MENILNKLLTRQLKKHFGSTDNIPEELKSFIQVINNTYDNFEDDTKLIQNSIEISSQELRDAYQKHKKDAEVQKETINKIKKAIFALNPTDERDINKHKPDESDSNYLFDSLIKLIEERKQAEEEILKLSKAVEQNPASIVITNLEGNIEYVNPKFCELTGYKKEEVIGQNPRILKTELATPEHYKELWKTILSGKEWRGELQNRKKSGEHYWEFASISPIMNDNQEISHFIAIKEDITERKLSEEERIKQAGLITSLLDSIPDIIFFKDIEGRYIGCNPPFAEFVGKERDEIIGKTDYDLFDKEIADIFRYYDNEMLKKKKPSRNEEWVTYPNGIKVLLDTLKTPYWASDGSLIGILGISRDITTRKESEEALLQSIQKFEAIITASPDGIGVASLDGKIELMSEKLALMHGYTLEEKEKYKDKTIFDFIDPSNHQLLHENIIKLLEGKKEQKITEYVSIKKDNSKYYCDVNSTVLRDSKGNPLSILFVERDISERKKAEEALQSKTSLLEAQTNATIDAILIVDLNQKILLINQRAIDLFEIPQHIQETYDDTLLLKHVVSSTKHPEKFLDKVLYLYDHNCEISNDEIEFKNGMILDRYSAPVLGRDGKNYGRIWTFRDITENKRKEEEIKRNAGLIGSLLDSIPDLIFFKDKEGVYMGGNPAFAEFSNRSKDNIAGITDYDLFNKEKADVFLKHDKRIMESRIPTHNDVWTTYPDGHKVLFDTLKTPYLGPDGTLIGILGISRDITERSKAEDKLKQVSTRLALATRAGGVGVWDMDLVNDNMLWDDQMFVLYGVEKGSNSDANKVWMKGIHPDDLLQRDADVKMAIDGEKEFNTEFRVIWPDNSIHNIRALAIVHRDETGKAIRMIGTNWDITEQKENEAVLLKAKQDAEMANKAKSIFLANMSHEIRTPLNAIIGFSQLMNRDNLLSDSQKEYNSSIIRAGEHLLTLINDILELSKVEAGRVVLNPTNIDLHTLLNDMQMIFSERAQSKQLQLLFEVSDDLPKYVIIDENKLRQIFINLIGNAVKFTDHGGIAVRAKVDKINEDNSKLIVEIQDTGSGIPEDEISNLFKHFVQTTTGIKKGSGTGLGLALSRELAILMGGNITVSSQVGKGSIFTLNVEIKEGTLETVIPNAIKRVSRIEKGETPWRILVVDDKEENLQVATNLLKLVGFETKEAINGADAIIKFEEWNPHLILMDIRMPIMDGYEATRRIKLTEKGKNTPIVALTASTFEEDHKKAELLNMQGYISKPFRENELFSVIENILGVKYIYEEEESITYEKYLNDDETIFTDITKLPDDLIMGMLNAINVADMDRLIEHIKSIGTYNMKLAQHLLELANNYNYDILLQLLSYKGAK